MKTLSCLAALLLGVTPVVAGDVALLLANEDYANGRDLRAADEVFDAVAGLEAAGFTVLEGEDLGADELAARVSALNAAADGTGRIVIALSGHFGQAGRDSWFVAVDADAPDLGGIGRQGMALSVVLEIASRAPGGAVVLLGTESVAFDLGEGLSPGFGTLEVPQGVTVIQGPTDDIADFAKDELLKAGRSLATSLADWPSLSGQGFLAPLVPFWTGDGAAVVAAPDPDAAQKALWRATVGIGSVEAYQAYLKQHPRGLFASEARAQIEQIEGAPLRQAEAGEAALNLSRDRRREIQRALSLLDYDPRGIDGIFGRGSRAAIAKWQEANGQTATGYVTGAQLTLLDAQAERRSAQLEEEARLRKVELERADRAYWQATGALGDEVGLRAYLERYPDGVFAEVALARLEPFEAARREAAAAEDRADWDAAVSVGTLEAYRGYVSANPEGAFVEQAQAQIAELEFQARNADALQAAARNEERLGLNAGTRRLIEDRLEKLGLKPGVVDGEFDNDTRRAIRRYQDARRLPKTGFLNQQTLVRLLADAVLR